MGPAALAQVLRPLQSIFPASAYPELLVGLDTADDAAVYRLNDDIALIQTTDFFPPVVDDPYDFGAIAAANAMSDVYAMGGEVLMALNVAAFPDNLDPAILTEIIRGGAEMVARAGGVIAGGHTIADDEPKYGLAVTGLVHPSRIITKATARPGDVLILTKPLGIGILTTAGKQGKATPHHLREAVEWMYRLNRGASQTMQAVGVHAATDITGYGLLGHGYEMAEKSGVRLRFRVADMPLLSTALDYAGQGAVPGGTSRNRHYLQDKLDWHRDVSVSMDALLHDPQTSGGMLIAVAPDRLAALKTELAARDTAGWVIGEVVAGEPAVEIW
jgi:selenide,water dikinase